MPIKFNKTTIFIYVYIINQKYHRYQQLCIHTRT